MAGPEVAIASASASAASKVLFSQGAYDFFFKWELDELLLDRLEALVNSTKSLLTVAEMRRLIQEDSIRDEWFKKARFAICDAEEVLDKIFTDVQKEEYRLGDSPGTVSIVKEKLRYKGKDVGRSLHPFKKTREAEMSKIITRLESIASVVTHLRLDTTVELAAIREMRGKPTSSVNDTIKFVGRWEEKKNIMKLLESGDGEDDALRVIPIVGLGGVGKTTFANEIFKECTSSKPPMFDVNAWTYLSDEFKVVNVIKSILDFITGKKPDSDELDSLQQKLKKQLQGKKFLIILDDMWSKDISSKDTKKWDELRTPFLVGKPGSRIIVTTRSKDVAETVTSVRSVFYQLNVMLEKESWSLFESVAFLDGGESAPPTLKNIGRGIVNKCKGLPLAIKMIGGLLLRYGNDVNKWRSVLDSEVWSIDVAKCKILPSLWLSYYHLPEDIKQCFAYISLFPKDYEFKMEEMVMLWVAEGFIKRTLTIEQQEDVARGYFDHLLLNFFIQESSSGTSQFVLHDLIHDLAEYVSRGLCVNWADINLQSRRLSYVQGEDEMLLYNLKVQKLTRLRTFLPKVNKYRELYLDDKILSDMLSNFKFLRILSLEGYLISVLPDSVGDMKLLRYMNISRTNIESLPLRICRLYNLQFLILRSCRRLKRLPAKIVDLVNLRFLDVHGTPLEEMPDGIGTMKNLQLLLNLVLRIGKSKHMKELKDLTSMHGELQISGLENITDPEHVVAAQFGRKEYLKELALDWEPLARRDTTLDERVLDAIQAHENLEELVLDWEPLARRDTTLDERVLDAIQAHENLKKLTISGYGGKRLSTWIVGRTPASYVMLRSLCIKNCFNLEALPSLGDLPALMNLTIVSSNCIKSMGGEFCGGSSNPFPALEKFEIRDMYALKTWSLPGRNRRGFFSLKGLVIQSCPELMTFPICFPSLTDLQIDGCYKLCGPEMCGRPSLGNLPALKNLTMKGLNRLESLNEGFYGDDSLNASFFPALEKLEISGMRGLKTWCFPGIQAFASLKELLIIHCRELVKIPFCFPCLTILEIWNCDNLVEIEMFGGEEGSVSTTCGHSLLSILVIGCPKLEEIPKSFVNLVDVDCGGCKKLVSLPRLQRVRKLFLHVANESMSLEAAVQDSTYLEELSLSRGRSHVAAELLSLDLNRLASLKRLDLVFTVDDDCERICWENDDKVAKRAPPNLSHLQINGWSRQMSAKILTHFSNLSGALITNLVFSDCPALESFPPDLELPSTLQSLQITYCHALKTISDGFLSGCSNSLRELTIDFCRNLVCLPRSLSTFQSIQKLYLSNCGALESLPDGFHRAATLRSLSLCGCPKLVIHKECGFPTALTHLKIIHCHQMKAVSNLRLTKLTSLAHLILAGFSETLRLEAGCLPVSIEELTIWDFPHLESLSGLLPTLKNLRRLDVRRCPLVNQKPRSKIKKLIPQQFI